MYLLLKTVSVIGATLWMAGMWAIALILWALGVAYERRMRLRNMFNQVETAAMTALVRCRAYRSQRKRYACRPGSPLAGNDGAPKRSAL